MKLRPSYITIRKSYVCEAFSFSPSSHAVDFVQSRQFAYGVSDGKGFRIGDLASDFKNHYLLNSSNLHNVW